MTDSLARQRLIVIWQDDAIATTYFAEKSGRSTESVNARDSLSPEQKLEASISTGQDTTSTSSFESTQGSSGLNWIPTIRRTCKRFSANIAVAGKKEAAIRVLESTSFSVLMAVTNSENLATIANELSGLRSRLPDSLLVVLSNHDLGSSELLLREAGAHHVETDRRQPKSLLHLLEKHFHRVHECGPPLIPEQIADYLPWSHLI